jgi:hypothetical protein
MEIENVVMLLSSTSLIDLKLGLQILTGLSAEEQCSALYGLKELMKKRIEEASEHYSGKIFYGIWSGIIMPSSKNHRSSLMFWFPSNILYLPFSHSENEIQNIWLQCLPGNDWYLGAEAIEKWCVEVSELEEYR